MRRQTCVRVMLVLSLCLLPKAAAACSCFGAAPCQALWMREGSPPNIFEATVESIDHQPTRGVTATGEQWVSDGRTVVHLKDVRPLFGESTTTIETSSSGASCGYTFAVGRRYVIDAYAHDGRFSTGSCSQTKPIEQAAALLDYVASLSRPSPGATISGTAQLSALGGFSPRVKPEGIAGLTMSIDGPVTRSTVTAANGAFSFTALPPGNYRLRATARGEQGFLEPPPPREVRLPNAHACHDAWVGVALTASIEGSVLDGAGRPVANASVALRHEDALTAPPVEGFGRFVGYAVTRTDGFGRYEFRSVPPGRYVAGLNLDSGPTHGSPYRAVAVTGPDGRPEVLDFPLGGHRVLPPLVAVVPATAVVTGRAAWPDGRPGVGLKVRATAHGETAHRFGASVDTTVDADGRFRLVLPEGVRHTIRAFADPAAVTQDADYDITAQLEAVAAPGDIALVLSRRR